MTPASLTAPLGVQFAPGTMLGRYELLATIGTGGMASVILARQRGPHGFEKLVVIKVVHPHLAQDQDAINMLLDEAKVAAQIDHPNVVHTYELGEAYGTFYIVMEYLAGESFHQVLKAARTSHLPMTPFMAAKIVADAADGLHFAHELRDLNGRHLNIVHRDVSPTNIVVQYNGSVKVVDFGIAKAEGRVTSTREGELKGKYGYMPPEQIKNEEMDARSDVFSLGVVLWEALAQRRLFHADNVAATLMQVLTADRMPPSSFFPQIPHALDIACLRALAPEPRDRYQSIAEMKQAIDDAIWQARIGTKDVEHYMHSLFSDRMRMRGAVARRATVEFAAVNELSGDALSVFREPISHHQRPHAGEINAPEQGSMFSPAPPRVGSTPHLGATPRATPLPAHLQEQRALHDVTVHPMPMERPSVHNLPYQVGPVMLDEPPLSATERSSKMLAMMIAGAIIGVAAALFLTLGGTKSSPKAKPITASNPVLDPDTLPDGPTKTPTIQPPPPPQPPVQPAEKQAVAPQPPAPREVAPPPEKTVEKQTPKQTPKPKQTKTTKVQKTERAKIETSGAKDNDEDEKPIDEEDGADADSLYKEASQAHMSGNLKVAEAAYLRAIKLDKGYSAAYRGLGILYQAKGNRKKAIEAFKTYLRLAPNAKDGGNVRSRIEQLQGES
jgi:serine/threonine protein kinase/outer membrane biosynthesis protein TonB